LQKKVRDRVRVTVRENGQELDFPGTSGFTKIFIRIPRVPLAYAKPDFDGRRTVSCSKF